MAIALSEIRDLLLPGLWQCQYQSRQWGDLFQPAISAPHIWIPKLSLPEAAFAGAAAAVIKNPEVTRRFWCGWSQ